MKSKVSLFLSSILFLKAFASIETSLPEKENDYPCGIDAYVTKEQKECRNVNGYYHEEAFKIVGGKCTVFRTCLLPATAEDIENQRECIIIDDGVTSRDKVYCSILYDNVSVQNEDTDFIEYIEKISGFYEMFDYEKVIPGATTTTKTIPIETSLPEKEKDYPCGIEAMVTKEQKECRNVNGYYHEEAFKIVGGKCTVFRTCLLPATAEDIENQRECIIIDDGVTSKDKVYCSILYDNVSVQNEDTNFIEYIEKISGFYEMFDYEKVIPGATPITTKTIPTITSTPSIETSLPEKEKDYPCGIEAMVTKEQKECWNVNGYYHEEAFKIVGGKCTVFRTCLLPATAEDIENQRECIIIDDGVTSKDKVYCSILYDNVSVQNEDTNFIEYIEKISGFYEMFDYEKVIPGATSTTTKTIPTITSTPSIETSLPEKEKDYPCGIEAMVTKEQKECWNVNGYYHEEAFKIVGGKCTVFRTCLLPATAEDIENQRECIIIDDGVTSRDKVYCSILYDNVSVQNEDTDFIEYIEKISGFYEMFDYEKVIPGATTTTKTIPIETSLPEKEKDYPCGIEAMVTKEQKECRNVNGYYHEEAFKIVGGKCTVFRTCLLPATAEDIENQRECIIIDDGVTSKDKVYCSILYDNVSVQNEDTNFIEYIEKISGFYEMFDYEKVIPGATPITTKTIPTITSTPSIETSLPEKEKDYPCGIEAMVTKEQKECWNVNGYYHEEAFKIVGGKCTVFRTCLLPATAEDIENQRECIIIDDGVTSKDKVYCSILYDNVSVQNEDTDFIEYIEKISGFYEMFDYEKVIPGATPITTKTIPTITSTPSIETSLPEKEKDYPCGIEAMVTKEQKECWNVNGYYHEEAFKIVGGKCTVFRTCLLPATAEDIENQRECIIIDDGVTSRDKVYCSILYDNVSVQNEDTDFIEYIEKISGFYEMFDYEKVIPGATPITTKTIPTITSTPSIEISLPEKEKDYPCGIEAMVTKEQKECWNVNGYYHEEAFKIVGGKCTVFRTCLLPATAEDIENQRECIIIDDGVTSKDKIYCSILYDNVSVQNEDTNFIEYIEKISGFYEMFDYEKVIPGATPITTKTIPTITSTPSIETSLPEKEKDYPCGIEAMVTKEQKECWNVNGYYHEEAFKIVGGKCTVFRTCLLPATAEDIENQRECIIIDDGVTSKDKVYCSILYDNVSVQNEDTDFIEYIEKISGFYEMFDYEKVIPGATPITTKTIPTITSTPSIETSLPEKEKDYPCGIEAMVTKEQKECWNVNGYYHEEAFKIVGGKCTVFRTCLLPATAEDIENQRECIIIDDGVTSRDKVYCSILYDNVSVQNEDTDFIEYIEKISGFYEMFDYEKVIPGATSTTTKTIPTITSTPSIETSLPEKEKDYPCGIEAMVTKEQKECWNVNGYYHEEAFKIVGGKCTVFRTCLLPATAEDIKNQRECIIIDDGVTSRDKVYCSILYDNVSVQNEDTDFIEYIEKISGFYEMFDYEKVIPGATPITTKTIPILTSSTTTKTVPIITTTTKTIPIGTSTTTTKTLPTSKECIPTTLTVTVKEAATLTLKETVTVTVQSNSTPTITDDSKCAGNWAQCGGQGFNGPNCCKSGLTCKKHNQYYSQCIEIK